MEENYYRVPQAAKILQEVVPEVELRKIENYLYGRVGKSIKAKIETDPLSGRRSFWIPEKELEKIRNQFMNK